MSINCGDDHFLVLLMIDADQRGVVAEVEK